jgi:hypothetical protein
VNDEPTKVYELQTIILDLQAKCDALRDLVTEAYPGDYPTNGWRLRAEKLGAWPPRVVER